MSVLFKDLIYDNNFTVRVQKAKDYTRFFVDYFASPSYFLDTQAQHYSKSWFSSDSSETDDGQTLSFSAGKMNFQVDAKSVDIGGQSIAYNSYVPINMNRPITLINNCNTSTMDIEVYAEKTISPLRSLWEDTKMAVTNGYLPTSIVVDVMVSKDGKKSEHALYSALMTGYKVSKCDAGVAGFSTEIFTFVGSPNKI